MEISWWRAAVSRTSTGFRLFDTSAAIDEDRRPVVIGGKTCQCSMLDRRHYSVIENDMLMGDIEPRTWRQAARANAAHNVSRGRWPLDSRMADRPRPAIRGRLQQRWPECSAAQVDERAIGYVFVWAECVGERWLQRLRHHGTACASASGRAVARRAFPATIREWAECVLKAQQSCAATYRFREMLSIPIG